MTSSESEQNHAEPEKDVSDINDVFEDIFLTEERIIGEHFHQGLADGRLEESVQEAADYGYKKGSEIGREIGFYLGIVNSIASQPETAANEKARSVLQELSDALEKYPHENDPATDLLHNLQQIRNKFRRLCALLKRYTMDRIKQQADTIVRFLQPNLAFINCHMVDYLTEQHWKQFVPETIKHELQTVDDYLQAKELFWGQFEPAYENESRFPGVRAFIDNTRKYRLGGTETLGTALTLDEFKDALSDHRKETRLKMTELMNEKKCHEVEVAAAAVASLCTAMASISTDSTKLEDILVIDAGDGKGYLSSRIALEHGIKVLGVDCNEDNTNGAEKRLERLKNKIPKAVRKSNLEEDEYFTNLCKDEHKLKTLYRTATQLIDFNTNLIELAAAYFPQGNHTTFCLCGLHTCGNLGPNCLRLFHENPTIRGICNVGCCYHLMQEQFVVDEFYNPTKVCENPGYGFPMSAHLRERFFALGRNARNLAAESIERACANRENPSDKLGYRALLQVVFLERGEKKSHQVGRLKCNGFVDYVRKAIRRLDLTENVTITDDSLLELEARFAGELEQLKVFYLIRQQFAPVIETLILLDRLLYLRECGYDRSFLVKLFEPVVSPRCYALIALK
uniref:Methyltranfer_dom domain-containing protein n=1 Tax=Anopheles minimus TaxID=112268 RepID=A0A182WFV0_9DIPT